MAFPARLSLAHLPTPLWQSDALDALLGLELWVKRDDMTAGAAAGNKIRKLEYLLADALAQGARHVITCGAEQSNHARTTALCAAELGLETTLFLRSTHAPSSGPLTGNLLIDRLSGARIVSLSKGEYASVPQLMRDTAREYERQGTRTAVIVEGGSDGLGAFGYVHAMREIREQLAALPPGTPAGTVQSFDAVAHACGSGGTAAGVALGAALTGLTTRVLAIPICDDAAYFEVRVDSIVEHARRLCPELPPPVAIAYPEGYQGPPDAVASDEQLAFLGAVAACSGLILDPVYTGKALFGLSQLAHKPRRVLFIHTGGLPGLFAHAALVAPHLPQR